MALTAAKPHSKDYFILGPALLPDNGVPEAIYALYYLPENYKLILPTTASDDKEFYDQVVSLVKMNSLQKRVHFSKDAGLAHSPEAFASSVLTAARVTS